MHIKPIPQILLMRAIHNLNLIKNSRQVTNKDKQTQKQNLRFAIFYPFHFDLIFEQLVNVGDNSRLLDVQDHKRWGDSTVKSIVGPRGRSRVEEKLALMLLCGELVGVARDEDVHVQLALHHCQTLQVTPWHHLMTMTQANAELSHCHHLLLRVVHVLIKVPPDNMHVTSQSLKVVEALLGAQVARTQDVLDLARHQQLLKPVGQGVASVRDVQVT